MGFNKWSLFDAISGIAPECRGFNAIVRGFLHGSFAGFALYAQGLVGSLTLKKVSMELVFVLVIIFICVFKNKILQILFFIKKLNCTYRDEQIYRSIFFAELTLV